ncbi:uncharacterized protein LOC120013245 [Tripterygium wilfordii]|uniref:uncharacterized protein LOC120013245 n=1 Tax=Tripterygium wilfordii TaxID=458696 RepID=UPI0018F7E82C|nr:uncharacterized protein LOC120013245 [Tripterygium wilfordii]
MVRRDAHRRLLTPPPQVDASDTVALFTRRSKPSQPRKSIPNDGSLSRSFELGSKSRSCTHCGGTGHTKARCYELIGYPDWWDPAKAPTKRTTQPSPAKAHHVSTEPTEPAIPTPAEFTANLATTDNDGHSHSEDNWLWY